MLDTIRCSIIMTNFSRILWCMKTVFKIHVLQYIRHVIMWVIRIVGLLFRAPKIILDYLHSFSTYGANVATIVSLWYLIVNSQSTFPIGELFAVMVSTFTYIAWLNYVLTIGLSVFINTSKIPPTDYNWNIYLV